MKRNQKLIKIEEILREYPINKAICNNPIASTEQKENAMRIIGQIELALGVLYPKELELINLRYFNNVKVKDLAVKLDITEQCVSNKTKNILNKISKVILL
ncbi:sigma-70 family RNA polymerase sigma factor [Haloimpatiens lingqiaonensis]|uniref:sigma-70 family RNA polymerase sigma factor n=1 Tax=Haloimpatiens lingqiaonensis TaxID=1380675 RepID=UPI0010FE7B20|nr:sigma-70 family RNA polymerase sigma factor [Haloimpatiens lingqiaonensis]